MQHSQHNMGKGPEKGTRRLVTEGLCCMFVTLIGACKMFNILIFIV